MSYSAAGEHMNDTCYITHSETVNIDNVVQSVDQDDKAKRMKIDEALDKGGCGDHHAIAIEKPSEWPHLP